MANLLRHPLNQNISDLGIPYESENHAIGINGFTAFQRLFEEYGLPDAIRYDNGLPLASPNGLFNLSKLSVWWLRLGISIERIKPGNPQQNGRHERMHLTLKRETTRPPGMNALQQQARFDEFVHEFNTERPHEALGMKIPDEVYAPSNRSYQGLPEVEYPFHDRDILVTACGRICMHRKKINISTVLAGQRLGIKEVDDGIWLISFMHYDLGYIDLEQRTLQTIDNPFATRLLPMSPGRTQNKMADRVGFEPTVRLHARWFSRPVPSTTRPPVRSNSYGLS